MAWQQLAAAGISAFGSSKGAPAAPTYSDANSGNVTINSGGMTFPDYPFSTVTTAGNTIKSGVMSQYEDYLLPFVIVLAAYLIKKK